MASPPRQLVIGIDCSTTACKALAWDADGVAAAHGRAPIPLDNPAPDGWQQHALDWWHALGRACQQMMQQLDPRDDILAACITHQRETVVVTDPHANPLHPALVWMDARCRPQLAAATTTFGAQHLHQLSGKPPHTTPSLYKLAYLFQQQPALCTPSARVMDVHGFLVWRLCGQFSTSLASADPLGLVDMQRGCWAHELLAWLSLDERQLPTLVRPGQVLGQLRPAAASHTGLPPGLPLVAGAGDGQAAGLGAGVMAPGRAYLNLGTAIVSGVLSHHYQCDNAFRTLYAANGDDYFLETDLQGGCFTIDWFIDHFLCYGTDNSRRGEVLARLEQEASRLPPGAQGLVLVPYLNGVMNPFWDANAAGLSVGLRGHHRPGHMYRAIIEGIAFEQRLHTEGVEAAAGAIAEMVVVGGGARSDVWCQLLADVLQKPMQRARGVETTALGAGMLAAASRGMHQTLAQACAAMGGSGRRFEPGAQQQRYNELYQQVYRPLYPSLRGPLAKLSALASTGAG
ncbi:MAG TPA: xylulose kinase [Sorangium sp.]|nr:xylulose kinase [Sorangium sp.]